MILEKNLYKNIQTRIKCLDGICTILKMNQIDSNAEAANDYAMIKILVILAVITFWSVLEQKIQSFHVKYWEFAYFAVLMRKQGTALLATITTEWKNIIF